jgi:hypothetical protein
MLGALIVSVCLAGAESDAADMRLPVPPAEDRQQAGARIREIFKAEVEKAATAEAKAAVAKKLVDLAGEDASAAEKFVLLDAAEALAIKAGDARVALAAVARRAELFQVDEAKTKADVLAELSKTAVGESAAMVIDDLLAKAAGLLSTDKLDEAKAAAQDAATAARRLKDKKRIKAVTETLDMIRIRGKEIDKIRPWLDRLAANKDDMEAVEFVGAYHSFQTERWDVGLPLLARCGNRPLATLAQSDLAVTNDPNSHLTVADGWVRYAEEQKQSAEAKACLRRAESHYQAALPGLTGLNKAKVTQALDSIGKKIGSNTQDWIAVFRSDDPKIWNTKTEEGFTRLAVPLVGLPNNIRYLRMRRQNGREVIIGMTKERLGAMSFDGRYGWNGAGQQMYGDGMLGIMDSNMRNPNVQGAVAIGYRVEGKPEGIYGGYGLGHSQLSGTKQDFCWAANDPLPAEPVEISVLCRELNSRELPLLLR